MDLVVYQVMQFQHVYAADGDRVVEGFARTSVVQHGLAGRVDARQLDHVLHIFFVRAVEYGHGHLDGGQGVIAGAADIGRLRHAVLVEIVARGAQFFFQAFHLFLDLHAQMQAGPAQMGFQDLADVHTGRYAQGVQHDLDRFAVRQERHILARQDTGHDTFVAVAAGHLVACADLAFLRNVDADLFVDSRRQLVAMFAGKYLDADDDARFAVGNAQGAVALFPGLFIEHGADQALFGGQFRFAFRRHFADQDITGAYFGTDADDAAFVQVLACFFGHVRDIAGDLFRSQFRIAGIAFVFFNMDGCIGIVLDQIFAQEHGIFVVIAFPGHIGYEDVVAQGQFAAVRGRAVGQHVTGFDLVAFVDDGALVDAGALVGTFEFQDFVTVDVAVFRADLDFAARGADDFAVVFGQDAVAGVRSDLVFHAGADDRSLRGQQRNGLALHVGAHQGAVRVIVFQERDQGRGDGHNLLRRNVHVVHAARAQAQDIVLAAGRDTFAHKVAVFIQRFVGLCDDVPVFFIGRQIVDDVGYALVFLVDAAVRGLDEAEAVDDAESCQGADQADVRAFRGLNGAHTAVMGVVYVANFVTGAFAGQAAGSQGGQTAFVRQFGQRVVLVHELGQLAAAEEFLDGGYDRTDVDQGLRRDDVHVLNGHTFADDAFHAGQADAELVLQQFADAAYAAVAQMVDVVFFAVAVHHVQQVAERGQDIFLGDGAQLFINARREDDADLLAVQFLDHDAVDAGIGVNAALFHLVEDILRHKGARFHDHFARFRVHDRLGQGAVFQAAAPAQFLVQFITAYISQVIALVIEEGLVDQLPCRFQGRRFAGAHLLVQLDDRFVAVGRRILFQGCLDGFDEDDVGARFALLVPFFRGVVVHMAFNLRVAEEIQDIFVRIQSHDAQQHSGRDFAGAVDARVNDVVQVRFKLNPGAAVRNDLRSVKVNGAGVHLLVIVGTGGTYQLADDDTFRTVDDERARRRHQREIAHEYARFLDFTGILVHQAYVHVQGSAVGRVAFLAFLNRVFRFAQFETFKRKFQIFVEILNRGDVVENLVQSFVDEPLVRFALQIDQMGHRNDFVDFSEAIPCSVTCLNRFKHVTLHSLFSLSQAIQNQVRCQGSKKTRSLPQDTLFSSLRRTYFIPHDMAVDVNHCTVRPL